MTAKLNAAQMIDALRKSRGFINAAADACGVSRTTFYNYMNRFETVKAVCDELREARHDFVESKLMTAINNDNITAIIFYLKTQCKQRGYVERHEHSGPDGGPVKLYQMVSPDDWDDDA